MVSEWRVRPRTGTVLCRGQQRHLGHATKDPRELGLEMLGNKAAGTRFDRRWLPSYRTNTTQSAIALRLKNQPTSTLKSTHFLRACASDTVQPRALLAGCRLGEDPRSFLPRVLLLRTADR